MDIQGNPTFRSDVSPYFQRIGHKTRRRYSDFSRIARKTGMSLAVALDIIRLHSVDNVFDHLSGDMFANFIIIALCMEIEMYTEETFRTFEAFWVIFALILSVN